MTKSKNKSKITGEHFKNAKPGQALKDGCGRICEIHANLTEDKLYPTLLISIPGYGTEEVSLHPEMGIIDEEWATMLELNDPSAEFIPQTV